MILRIAPKTCVDWEKALGLARGDIERIEDDCLVFKKGLDEAAVKAKFSAVTGLSAIVVKD